MMFNLFVLFFYFCNFVYFYFYVNTFNYKQQSKIQSNTDFQLCITNITSSIYELNGENEIKENNLITIQMKKKKNLKMILVNQIILLSQHDRHQHQQQCRRD